MSLLEDLMENADMRPDTQLLRQKYEELLQYICDTNNVHIQISSFDPNKEFHIKYELVNSQRYSIITINWDECQDTIFNLLLMTKLHFNCSHLTKENYDWSFIMNYFTKKDLKNGDVIVLRDGTIGIVIKDLYAMITEHLGTMSISDPAYDNDLATYKLDGFGEGYTIQDAEIEWDVIGNKFDNPELLKGDKDNEG